ncbi:MAG: dimethylmenaquinone methyltransferase [Acidobacteriia bacterium]|nr:dimethylmenaquinone methyltransferase [Terriglobia bacterium]
MTRLSRLALSACAVAILAPALSHAQLFTLTKEQLIELTSQNPFERFADGRPKIPDALMERARGMSAEEVWAGLNQAGGGARGGAAGRGGAGGGGGAWRNQYEDGFQVLHPKLKLVGRAFTVQFMPARPDLDTVLNAKQQAKGLGRLNNQFAIDMLQPGDVLVVDLFGKIGDGTIVGDNLFYYIMKTTKTGGIVVDGAVRDLEGISEMEMPAYFRKTHPSALSNVTLTGINIPVRIGNVTVMPGDLVVGDPEGVYFVPPHLVEGIVDAADRVHIHDEWTRKKFDEGKYKSSEIYSSPRDPALQKEYQEYLTKRLEELHKKQ